MWTITSMQCFFWLKKVTIYPKFSLYGTNYNSNYNKTVAIVEIKAKKSEMRNKLHRSGA